jgi:DNA mismatch repair protein MutS2
LSAAVVIGSKSFRSGGTRIPRRFCGPAFRASKIAQESVYPGLTVTFQALGRRRSLMSTFPAFAENLVSPHLGFDVSLIMKLTADTVSDRHAKPHIRPSGQLPADPAGMYFRRSAAVIIKERFAFCMNEQVLSVLEYDKIIDQLAERAATDGGKKACRELRPMDNIRDIIAAQKETSDALARMYRKGGMSFSGVRDIRESLARLRIGSTLSAGELLGLSSLLNAVGRAVSYGKRDPQKEERPADALDGYFDALTPLPSLAKEIDRCIISEEEIADDASPGLKSVRRGIRQTGEKVHQQLAGLLVSQRSSLQDAVITMRDGRYCVPVKAENKSSVPGLVHDQSSSGSTLFIEPMSVVNLNNELRELQLQEKKEIEKVLADLSNQAASFESELQADLEIMEKLDFIFAKGSLSREMRGVEPRLTTKGIIRLKKARHPLLDKNKVVPIDLTLGETFDQLIITGPNTGGKTVTLKTVGLLTLMACAGLHIPAFEGSTINVFQEVYADIGDKQSIELSLSTFSSHMTNIVKILDQADSNSLILFDELCAGTDPNEGAALAQSILQFLHKLKIRTMATTHYSEIKIYALSTDHVENACCEFDVETLQPTYRLLIGIPGKSNAFAISRKLGLPDDLIEDAQKLMDHESANFEDVIAGLEESRVKMEADRQKAAEERAEAERIRKDLAEQRRQLDEKREAILQKSRDKAARVLQEAKDYADESIRILNKTAEDGGVSRAMEQERTRLREKLSQVSSSPASNQQRPKKHKAIDPSSIRIGDTVKVLSLGLSGTVTSLPDASGNMTVQMGILTSQVNIKDIDPVKDSAPESKKKSLYYGSGADSRRASGASAQAQMEKASRVSPEINLIGMTVDEAMPVLDKYLDDAYLSHIDKVRIVHGRGTGALKNAVWQKLRKTSYIKDYRLGEYGEGDSGVTIATFR